MTYFNHYSPASGWHPDAVARRWLILFENQVVISSEGAVIWTNLPDGLSHKGVVCGEVDGKSVGVLSVDTLPDGHHGEPVRAVLQSFISHHQGSALFHLISHGRQVLKARSDQSFCSRCGGKNAPVPGEWSQRCGFCDKLCYPIISPCVIVLIRRGDELLLVRHHRHGKDSPMHTLVAGFIEPGESAEQAVIREVREETGLLVKEVTYQYSQSWPFPHSLMLGFYAEYDSGTLTLDNTELCDGGWFPRWALPELPPEFTIARQMIERVRVSK